MTRQPQPNLTGSQMSCHGGHLSALPALGRGLVSSCTLPLTAG